jgi:hypothetical protein
MRPDVIWTHTVPWVPREASVPGWIFLEVLGEWRKRGARVLLHDGDPRAVTRFPWTMAEFFDVALCNHSLPRQEWKLAAVRWPYAAMSQRKIAEPVAELRCGLLFAGIVRKDDGLYSARGEALFYLRERLGHRLTIRTGGVNDRMQSADVAASAQAVLGFGRPEVPGWVDTRVFQYPGAGGLLLHDAAAEFLTPGVHFVEFARGSDGFATAQNIAEAFGRIDQIDQGDMRLKAFEHIQANHTWRHRVEQALQAVGLR